MKFLTKSFWHEIMLPDKGEKFEALVKEVLAAMHPTINWSKTPKTHDGKKDFTITLPIEEIGDHVTYWVECKNYAENVSINLLSPTLVMAVIKNANGIYIFSYSSLNTNAEISLGQFAEKVGKKIWIFDDERLETEILKYPDIIRKYFPSFIVSDYLYEEPAAISGKLIFNRDIAHNYENTPEYIHKGEKVLNVNETFCIDVFIRNLGLEDQKFVLKLDFNEYVDYFSLLNKPLEKNNFSEEISINVAGVFFKRIIFKLEKYVDKIELPKVYIYDQDKLVAELSAGRIKGNWIINAPLIGSQYLEIVDNVKALSSHRNCMTTYGFYGESGTGKSRLFKEIIDVLLSNGYRIHSEDGDFQNERSTGLRLVQRIISFLSGLPLKNQMLNSEELLKTTNGGISYDRIGKMLYSDSIDVTDTAARKEIIEIIFSLIGNKPLAVLVDNIQFFDEDLSVILHSILNEYIDASIPILFVLSFNTDFLFRQTKGFQLLEKLKHLSKRKPGQFYTVKINGFKEAQSHEFVEHCIPGAMRDYPVTFKYIIKKAGNYPLYIEQMLLLLYDKGVIKKRNDFFYVFDINNLHRILNTIPDTITELIKVRWEFILNQNPDVSFDSVLRFITLFQRVSVGLLIDFGLREDILNQLIDLGVLELSASGQIIFRHSQLLAFFNRHFFSSGIDRETALSAIRFIESNKIDHHYSAQYFISRNTIKPNDPDILLLGANCLLNETISVEYRPRFAMYLYDSLRMTGNTKDLPLLKLYTLICDVVKKYEEFSKALLLFEEIYKEKFENHNDYLNDAEDYFHFILRYSNSYLSLHKDKSAHDILLTSLNVLERFVFKSEKNKSKAKAEILNRLCVTYKSLNEPHMAIACAEESLDLAKHIGDKKIIIKNYIDKGYVFYKDLSSSENLLTCWDMAWNLFNEQYDKSLEEKRVSALYHKSLVELIRNRRDKALASANEALLCAERNMDVFNRIKIMIVIVIINYLNKSERGIEIESMAKEIIDLCAHNNSIRSYWTSWHLLGKVTRDVGAKENAYLVSLELLNSFIVNEKMGKLYLYFYEDLAMVLRARQRYQPAEIQKTMSFIPGRAMKERFAGILKMTDEEFRKFRKDYKPMTPITDGNTNFPCP